MSAFGSKADISKSTIRGCGCSISADAIQQPLWILLAEAMAQTARGPAKHSAAASRQSNRGSIQSGQNTFVRRWSISCAMKWLRCHLSSKHPLAGQWHSQEGILFHPGSWRKLTSNPLDLTKGHSNATSYKGERFQLYQLRVTARARELLLERMSAFGP